MSRSFTFVQDDKITERHSVVVINLLARFAFRHQNSPITNPHFVIMTERSDGRISFNVTFEIFRFAKTYL